MSDPAYKNTGEMFVCTPTNYFKDVDTLRKIVADFKSKGGKLPSEVDTALEVAKTGKNMEDSLNVACEGLFRFYLSESVRCAKEQGYSSLEQFYAHADWDAKDTYDLCMLPSIRQWQYNNVNYLLNIHNPESAIRQFMQRTKDQVFALTAKYIKKSVLKRIKEQAGQNEKTAP